MKLRKSRLRGFFFLRGQRSQTYANSNPHSFHSTRRTGDGQKKTDLRAVYKTRTEKNAALAGTSIHESLMLHAVQLDLEAARTTSTHYKCDHIQHNRSDSSNQRMLRLIGL